MSKFVKFEPLSNLHVQCPLGCLRSNTLFDFQLGSSVGR